MNETRPSRRRFLHAATRALTGAIACPHLLRATGPDAPKPRERNERPGIGAIGMRYQGTVIAEQALPYGDLVAICDVDRQHAETARQKLNPGADLYEDYRELLDRRDVDVVIIGTPDHWHTAITIAACKAGKDVYVEKPLTLTVGEGKLLCRAVRETGRVVQVGSWQRSDWRFRLACEMVRAGRIGKLRRVMATLGKNPQGGPFPVTQPPPHFNWELWQGQTPWVEYIKERTHYTFRWWYEYSGGQMTDWGAHHIDIAHWGMGMDRSGPLEVDGRGELPQVPDGYNVAVRFEARLVYPGGMELIVSDEGKPSVVFEGEEGRIGVARGRLWGDPVEALKDQPLPRDRYQLYAGDSTERPLRSGKREATMNHMGNFFDCLRSRKLPISDVFSQHRTATACHVANISMRLGRKLRWDPERELFPDDREANGWLQREQRQGYEITV